MSAAVAAPFFIWLTPIFAQYFLIIRATDAVLSTFYIFYKYKGKLGYKGASVIHIQNRLVAEILSHISKIITMRCHIKFGVNRMYSYGPTAASLNEKKGKLIADYQFHIENMV